MLWVNFLIPYVLIIGMQSFVYWNTLKVLLEKAYYMVIITIVKLYVIGMLIGQDIYLIEDLLLDIVFLLVMIWFLGRARNNM